MKKYFLKWDLVMLLCLVVLLRFWKVPELFVFGIDEEYGANLAWTIYHNFHIIWVGVSLSLGKAGLDGFYLGPGITYLNALLFKLSAADPVILGYFGSLLGVVTSVSILYVAKHLYNKSVALIAFTWYGVSTLMVFFDRRFWNLTPIPFLSIWLYYSLIKSRENTKWLILSSALLALSLHSHLILLVYIFPLIYFTIKERKTISPKTWIGMAGMLTAISSTLILFEYLKKGQNIFLPVRLIQQIVTEKDSTSFNVQPILTAVTELFYSQPYGVQSFPLWISLLATACVIIILIALYRLHTHFKSRLLLFLLLFYLLAVLLWPGIVHTYYLLAFFPLFAVCLGVVFQSIDKRIIAVFISLFAVVNIAIIIQSPTDYGLASNKELVQKVSQYVGDKSFYLEYSKDAWGGFRYLFKVYGKTPVVSSSDQMFNWMFPDEISQSRPAYDVIISSERPTSNRAIIHEVQGNGFNAYIYKNY